MATKKTAAKKAEPAAGPAPARGPGKAPALQIELKPIGWLVPYERNAKKHPPDQVKRVAAVIRDQGWDQPIVAWTDGTIIKGHGRRLAAIELGLDQVPVIVRYDLSRDEADKARISDNAVSSLQYDTQLLQDELKRLMDAVPELDLDSLGLSDKEKTLLAANLVEPDLGAIIEDTQGEAEAWKEEDRARVAAADDEMVPLAKAFGFSKLRTADGRVLTAFMAEAEEISGKTGYDAFIEGLRRAAEKGLS